MVSPANRSGDELGLHPRRRPEFPAGHLPFHLEEVLQRLDRIDVAVPRLDDGREARLDYVDEMNDAPLEMVRLSPAVEDVQEDARAAAERDVMSFRHLDAAYVADSHALEAYFHEVL